MEESTTPSPAKPEEGARVIQKPKGVIIPRSKEQEETAARLEAQGAAIRDRLFAKGGEVQRRAEEKRKRRAAKRKLRPAEAIAREIRDRAAA